MIKLNHWHEADSSALLRVMPANELLLLENKNLIMRCKVFCLIRDYETTLRAAPESFIWKAFVAQYDLARGSDEHDQPSKD